MQIPRLREWREARALTQVELAERAGVSPRSVAGYEAGAGARPPTVRKLAGALEVGVADLFPKASGSSPELSFHGVLADEPLARPPVNISAASGGAGGTELKELTIEAILLMFKRGEIPLEVAEQELENRCVA